MSLNPPIGDDNVPTLYRGEVLFIRREKIRLIAKIGGFSIQTDGTLFASSIRLCFVADKPTEQFRALEIPLMLIRNERFNQPIFGCNNLSMNVAANDSWGTNMEFTAKFEFRNGGAQTFLRIFWKVMSGVNETRNIPVAQPVPEYVREIASGSFVHSAFVDPTDPSYLYTAQPYQPTYNLPTSYPVPTYYSQPAYVDLPPPAPQPVYSQPQPMYQPAPQVYAQPQPGYAQPQPGYAQPAPQVYSQPQPGYAQPAPQVYVQSPPIQPYDQPQPVYQPQIPYAQQVPQSYTPPYNH